MSGRVVVLTCRLVVVVVSAVVLSDAVTGTVVAIGVAVVVVVSGTVDVVVSGTVDVVVAGAVDVVVSGGGDSSVVVVS